MSKCLYCYQELEEGQVDFHPGCARRFFGSEPYLNFHIRATICRN